MARALAGEHKKRQAAAEADAHGGVIALKGGPAGEYWFWRDWYLSQPESAQYRNGYRQTNEKAENSGTDPNGVKLAWYGLGEVWRFDGALVKHDPPLEHVTPLWISQPAHCGCGERILLVQDGRATCDRCRIGTPGLALLWSDTPRSDADVEHHDDPVAVLDTPPDPPAKPEPVEPAPDPAEVAAWIWQQLAPGYDR